MMQLFIPQSNQSANIAMTDPPAMHTETALVCKTFQSALTRLRKERVELIRQVVAQQSDPKYVAARRQLVVEHEIAIYELCIDRALEHEEYLNARPVERRMQQRERFYRLMASLASAENQDSDGAQRIEFISGADENAAWDSHRWVDELHEAAKHARQDLISD
jgi:hypothetical protein